MEYADTLDEQMYRFGFWSVLIVIASGIASGFMPLDMPGGTPRRTPTEYSGCRPTGRFLSRVG